MPPYKDGGKIKPQAARFHIFEYIEQGGQYVVNREISLAEKDVKKLVWTVHLANRKASFFKFDGMAGADRAPTKGRRNDQFTGDRSFLDIDPRPRSISGKSAKPIEFRKGTSRNPTSERWPTPPPSPKIETLGTLLTDADGRLVVLGGRGESGSIPGAAAINNYANNDGWFDDVSDGPVTAILHMKDGPVTVTPAWVICPPPDFAPHLTSVVTLYDVMYDVAARELTLSGNEAAYTTGALKALGTINQEFKNAGKPVLASYKPDFNEEIYPILYRAAASMFLVRQAVGHHGQLVIWSRLASSDPKFANDRQYILNFLHDPDAKVPNASQLMPKLLGDEPYPLPGGVHHPRARLTVTPTQYALLQQWAKGNFIEPSKTPPQLPSTPHITPEGLDRAALESCVGGAFFPGIEVGWQIRSASIYQEPFRVKHGVKSPYLGDTGVIEAGFFTRQMALPWQADFLLCKSEAKGPTAIFPGTGLWGWWPAQRPDWIFESEAKFRASPYPKSVQWDRATQAGNWVQWSTGWMPSYDEMLANWRKFGFILETNTNIFTEVEREPDIP